MGKKEWSPLELHALDMNNHYRTIASEWTIEGNPYIKSYEDHLTQTEQEYIEICPELIFLAEDGLDMLKSAGVTDDFIIEIEKCILALEKESNMAIDGKNGDAPILKSFRDKTLPDDLREPMNTVYQWYININDYTDRKSMTENLVNELVQIYDIQMTAKKNVQDYLDYSYDTIEEIR